MSTAKKFGAIFRTMSSKAYISLPTRARMSSIATDLICTLTHIHIHTKHMYICIYMYVCIHICVYMYVHHQRVGIKLFVYYLFVSIYLSIYLSVYLFMYRLIHASAHLSLFVSPSTWLVIIVDHALLL